MRHLAILGATGSIGQDTLAVVAEHPDKFRVVALAAHQNYQQMLTDCLRFKPRYAVMVNEQAASELRGALKQAALTCEVLSGTDALCDIAALDDVDTVMAAIVGGAGLESTFAAARAGKRILLANKEALVMAGGLLLAQAERSGAQILPVDSEHNAIFQCLPASHQRCCLSLDLTQAGVDKILLTGSGGALRDLPLEKLPDVTPEQALAHPNWSMGAKVTIDSATMMNKGLEYIEARWLFNASFDQIDIVVHPQSIIHSMIQYQDGSTLAQLGPSSMRVPIAYALSYPERLDMPASRIAHFTQLSDLTFKDVEWARYPCLKLAMQATANETDPIVLNAANEIAVAAFLHRKIGFCEIAQFVEVALSKFSGNICASLYDILQLDSIVRSWTHNKVKQR